MVDYVRLQQTALRLVKANGREITFEKQGAVEENGFISFGAFVVPNSLSKDGLAALGTGTQIQDLIARSQEIIIVAQGDENLLGYTVVHDPHGPIENGRWHITGIQLLQPGRIGVLAFIGVDR